jgi:hypothetical protein
MTIKFICTCGKHLRARDEMASRRSVCPRCGSPVGIPSLKPTHPGTTAAPMTPLERLRHARHRAPLPAATPAPQEEIAKPPAPRRVDPRLVRLLSSRGIRRPELTGRHLEKNWNECLVYPLRAWRLCLGLALLLTLLSAGFAVFLPRLLAEPTSDPQSVAFVALRMACGLLLLLTFAFPCSFLECVLTSAVAGEVFYIVWSGNPLNVVLRSGVKWLTCFLAGPVVFAAFAWLYWLRCGDPTVLDWLILMELGIVALGYWMYALLALSDQGRLRDLTPVAVADMAHRLGWRGLAVVLAAACLLLAHGWVLIVGVAGVHMSAVSGLALLAAGWFSGIFWSTFFCRLLGVWCHRSRVLADNL